MPPALFAAEAAGFLAPAEEADFFAEEAAEEAEAVLPAGFFAAGLAADFFGAAAFFAGADLAALAAGFAADLAEEAADFFAGADFAAAAEAVAFFAPDLAAGAALPADAFLVVAAEADFALPPPPADVLAAGFAVFAADDFAVDFAAVLPPPDAAAFLAGAAFSAAFFVEA